MNEPAPHLALSSEHFGTVIDSVSDAVMTVNREFIVTSFNTAAESLTGFHRAEAVGRLCHEILRSSVCRNVADCPMTQLMGTGSECLVRRCTLLDRHNREAALTISARALRNGAGEIVGGVETFRVSTPADGSLAPPPSASAPHTRGDQHALPPGLPILEASQRRIIEDVLRKNQWNRSAACQELGLSRTTLWRKMRRLGLSARPPHPSHE
jgi:PAS domain S-box-containing protein